MAHLSLSCLGPLQIMLDGRPVVGFRSNKVRALLVYLMVEAERPHHREVLAGHLWSEWPDREALSNLRYALSNLRRTIGDHAAEPPYLLISRETLQFNSYSDYYLDVAEFMVQTNLYRSPVKDLPNLSCLEEAVTLYRGGFLEGFSIKDSAAFEEWTLVKRQQIAEQLSYALRYLVTTYEDLGHYEQGLVWARQQIEAAPWDELAHQQLMRLLALSGQRSAALVQYETCRRLLLNELGVEPARETSELYEEIRSETLSTAGTSSISLPDLDTTLPQFLEEEPAAEADYPIFVSREHELARMQGFLDLALTGQGQVAFVTGEAGSGKTALIQEFSRQSQQAVADLCVAGGNCNAYTGIGDPYLPFREILEMLTADVEAKWVAGAITTEHARRLWHTLPEAAQLLVESGQGLINTFIPGTGLRDRVEVFPQGPGRADLLLRINELAERQPTGSSRSPGPQQNDLFEQYTRVMQSLAQGRPLLLVLDDLQWADLGTVSLLFHLGRHLEGVRILLVGAYRREEVALGRDGERHALEPVINEIQRMYGDTLVNVDQAGGIDFIEALLDSEPNQLSPSFRGKLARLTRGHPLFTVELLRGMQDRGDLIQSAEGGWIEAPELDWETLPVRVEAAIAVRIGRLALPLQEALQVAAVEGEDFTAEVVARVLGISEREMVQRLSSDLDRRHRLVRPLVVDRLGIRRLSRYRFRNYLFQKYLYDNLDEIERTYLHEDLGNALEEIYGDQVSDIAVQLAWHYQEAGIAEKAVEYLYQAGEKALRLTANKEAIAHMTRAIELLMLLTDSPERVEKELALQLKLGIAYQSTNGVRSPEVLASYTRAKELCVQKGNTAQLCEVVGEMAVIHFAGAEYRRASEIAAEALDLAHQAQDPLLVALSHWHLGFILFALGEPTTARMHLKEVISFYEPQRHHHSFVVHGGKDAGVVALAFDACCLWCLGYPDQALARRQQALTLAHELNHPFSLADVICHAGCLFDEMRRETTTLKENAEKLIRLGNEKVTGWKGTGTYHHGVALIMLGQFQEGITQVREGLAIAQSMDIRCYLSGPSGMMALAQAQSGQIDEGVNTLADTLAAVEESEERYLEPELYRIQAELFLMQGMEGEAENSLQKAIAVAQEQHARSWELWATTCLARLWQKQGRTTEAYQVLKQIYDWFSEGFNTTDLLEAKALLEELS